MPSNYTNHSKFLWNYRLIVAELYFGAVKKVIKFTDYAQTLIALQVDLKVEKQKIVAIGGRGETLTFGRVAGQDMRIVGY